MELPIVLCFLLGTSIAAPGSEDGNSHYDTIVIGLGAAGVTAASTLTRAGRRVLGLEAQSRVGGRVHIVAFGDGLVELGAEWIHGTNNSVVYNLAQEYNISTLTQSNDIDVYRSDGGPVDQGLMNKLLAFYMDNMDQASTVAEPLGVALTRNFKSLFPRHIQGHKLPAIEKLSMGTIGKVIFSFDKPWWPQNMSLVGFIWTGEDRKKVGKDDLWITNVYGASRPMGSSNTLTMWTSGDVAKKVETLPEDVVKSKCIQLLQRFIGDTLKIIVPQPTAMLSFMASYIFTKFIMECVQWWGFDILWFKVATKAQVK